MQLFMTSAEAGRVLGVTAQRVRALRKSGELRIAASTESGVFLFRRRDVERLVARRARGYWIYRRRGAVEEAQHAPSAA